MCDEHTARRVSDGISENSAKKTYVAPALRVYGTVGQFTQGTASVGTDFGGGKRRHRSDPALKEAVVHIGTHPLGFGIYLFDYKPEFRDAFGHGRQFGVMADEVAEVVPQAIGRDANGYMTVDYGRLGITAH
jgi:hypothetical protein